MDVARGGGKAGMAGGGVGLGLRVQASVSRSQVSARGQGSAVHDRHAVFRGPSFFCFIKRSASGSGKARDSQEIRPLEIPGRDRWILAKSRPRDLFVDDSARFVDKSWSPAPAALASTMRGGCCPSGVRANLSPMPFPTMNLALKSHPSGPVPRAGWRAIHSSPCPAASPPAAA
jgi:hypothetical protein